MPKRAVMMSFELWKQWMTQGFRAAELKCTEGLPSGAVLTDIFPRQYGAIGTPELVAVFESPEFEALQEGEYTVQGPNGESFPVLTPVFETRRLKDCYSVLSWRDGDQEHKISIRSVGQPSVLFDWQPDNAEGSNPLVPDSSCQFDVSWLC